MFIRSGQSRLHGERQSPTWSLNRSSSAVRRASWTSLVSLSTTMPGCARVPQDGTSLPLIFTRQTWQLFNGPHFSKWQSAGISRPIPRAACSTLWPDSAETAWESMVKVKDMGEGRGFEVRSPKSEGRSPKSEKVCLRARLRDMISRPSSAPPSDFDLRPSDFPNRVFHFLQIAPKIRFSSLASRQSSRASGARDSSAAAIMRRKNIVSFDSFLQVPILFLKSLRETASSASQ